MRGFGNAGGMGNMGNMLKQAQRAMQNMQRMQEEIAATELEGTAGGGMVRVKATGDGMIHEIVIDPQVVDPNDVEMLQDLVVSAVRDAIQRSIDLRGSRMQEITGGLPIPGGLGF